LQSAPRSLAIGTFERRGFPEPIREVRACVIDSPTSKPIVSSASFTRLARTEVRADGVGVLLAILGNTATACWWMASNFVVAYSMTEIDLGARRCQWHRPCRRRQIFDRRTTVR
jgi:hypothetical protein